MANNVDILLVEKILKNIPRNMKPVEYLMDTLDMSRNAVYRRLRFEKSFSFHEVMKLSSLMGFSLDDIAFTVGDGLHSEPSQRHNSEITAENSIVALFDHFRTLLVNFVDAGNSQVILTANRLQILSIGAVEPLFRFLYYQLMYQLREIKVNCPFSEVQVPESILSLNKDFSSFFMSINNKDYIIDSNLYFNLVRDIQYFYQIKLISESELLYLKEHLHIAIKQTQAYMEMGVNDLPIKKSRFYLSGMEVTSNTLYSINEGKEESHFWLHSTNPISTANKRVCHMHKLWIDSLMRSSTLISGVNENARFGFISKQLDSVDNMDKIMY